MFTDLPEGPAVDELPEVLDLAFPQWCAYFGQDAERLAAWHVVACVVRDKSRFRNAGLLPDSVPDLPGYTLGAQFWVMEQSSDYYRRHLFLHEGTHSFMFTVLRGCGPYWYKEAVAEMLGTHRWKDGRLELNYMPATTDEVPMWGRVKIIKEAFAAHRAESEDRDQLRA